MLAGCYKTPAIYVNVKGVFTNTPAIDAYRGAGRPEASFVLERLVDVAGMKTGLGPIEIRRRNLIPSSEMPYKTALNQYRPYLSLKDVLKLFKFSLEKNFFKTKSSAGAEAPLGFAINS